MGRRTNTAAAYIDKHATEVGVILAELAENADSCGPGAVQAASTHTASIALNRALGFTVSAGVHS